MRPSPDWPPLQAGLHPLRLLPELRGLLLKIARPASRWAACVPRFPHIAVQRASNPNPHIKMHEDLFHEEEAFAHSRAALGKREERLEDDFCGQLQLARGQG